MEYLIGFDIGSSSIKAALVDAETGKALSVVQEPQVEMGMDAPNIGWAEQDPEMWWQHLCKASKKLLEIEGVEPHLIKSVGIAYQMHGLVLVNGQGLPIRKSIIWCDSRAVDLGNQAYNDLGEAHCKAHLLNSPGNFTASKLKWVKENEPDTYAKAYKMMLPGDYMAYRLTGTINTTVSGLSEGIFWDFKEEEIAQWLLDHYGIDTALIPDVVDTFSQQGTLSEEGAKATGLAVGTPLGYRAGDQPNNALSLNVFEPGEVAATGGTSGVVYAVTDRLSVQESERVNNFAHVNHTHGLPRIGKLLCINGAGILFRWMQQNLAVASYDDMNALAQQVGVGSNGLCVLPFGNGAERMLLNKNVGAHIGHLDLNTHHKADLCRASLEGIAFAFAYGMEVMQSDGVVLDVMRVGDDNLFRSPIFSETIATLAGCHIEVYHITGAVGAARASQLYLTGEKRFTQDMLKEDLVTTYAPQTELGPYQEAYALWKNKLKDLLTTYTS